MKFSRGIFSLASVILVALLVYAAWYLYSAEQFNTKGEWSVVQAVEYKYRSIKSDEHLILERTAENYCLAGIITQSSSHRVWVLLNAKSTPYWKQIPEGNFNITVEELKKVAAFCRVQPEVLARLISEKL